MAGRSSRAKRALIKRIAPRRADALGVAVVAIQFEQLDWGCCLRLGSMGLREGLAAFGLGAAWARRCALSDLERSMAEEDGSPFWRDKAGMRRMERATNALRRRLGLPAGVRPRLKFRELPGAGILAWLDLWITSEYPPMAGDAWRRGHAERADGGDSNLPSAHLSRSLRAKASVSRLAAFRGARPRWDEREGEVDALDADEGDGVAWALGEMEALALREAANPASRSTRRASL